MNTQQSIWTRAFIWYKCLFLHGSATAGSRNRDMRNASKKSRLKPSAVALCEWERACSLNQLSVASSCCAVDEVCR